MKLPLPPATQCGLIYQLLRPHQGNDNLLILYSFQFVVFALNLLILCSGKAKPSKRVKKNKSAEETVLTEPELGTAVPESSTHEPPPEPAQDTPTPTADPPTEQAVDGSDNPEVPSPVRTDDPQDTDVEITRTGFAEPRRPTVLAKCSTKEELLDHRRVKLDVADYTHMSIGEVFSGYMSQVHSSRNLEIDMVKQMHQKFEVPLYCLLHNHLYHTSPQVYDL